MKQIRVKTIYSIEYRKLLEALVKLRQQAGLTQRDLAGQLGVQPSWVAKVELGERRLDVVETLRLVKRLGGDPVKIVRQLAALID